MKLDEEENTTKIQSNEKTRLIKRNVKESNLPKLIKMIVFLCFLVIFFALVSSILVSLQYNKPAENTKGMILIISEISGGILVILLIFLITLTCKQRKNSNLINHQTIEDLLFENNFSFLEELSKTVNSSKDEDYDNMLNALEDIFGYKAKIGLFFEFFIRKVGKGIGTGALVVGYVLLQILLVVA